MSLEERLGRNWLNKLGIVTLVIGLALFLGYQLSHVGPLGKSLTGLALSGALLGGGLLLERRERYRLFARAAIGGGWALTFFVSFAVFHVSAMQVLHSQLADLVLMLGVAGAMVAHSLRYKSQVVTSLAFLLAFVTVGISQITVFSLVAGIVLATALLIVAARERWYELALCGTIGAYANHFFWLLRVLPEGAQPGVPFVHFVPSVALLLAYWLLFRLFYVVRTPLNRRQEVGSTAAAIVNSIGLMSLLKYQSTHPEWAFAALLTFGLADLTFAFIARPRFRTGFVVLSCIGAALVVAAVPFRFGGTSWTLLWLLQAELFFAAGMALRERVLTRLGIAASLAAALVWTVLNVAPIVDGAATHRTLPVVLAGLLGAALFWLNAEFVPRRWPWLVQEELDRSLLFLSSYVAPVMLAATLWLALPAAWTAVAWIAAALALGWLADALDSSDFAAQADLLSVVSVARLCLVNFTLDAHLWGALTLRDATVIPAALMLYAAMRRRKIPAAFNVSYAGALYSTCAAMLLTVLAWCELAPPHVGIALAVFSFALVELGLRTKRLDFRAQGLAITLIAFVQSAIISVNAPHTSTLTLAALSAPWMLLYLRLSSSPRALDAERKLAPALSWMSVLAVSDLLWRQTPALWHGAVFAALAAGLLGAALLLRRRVFLVQAYTLLAGVVLNAIVFDFARTEMYHSRSIPERLMAIASTCIVLLCAQPVAMRIHRVFGDEPWAHAEHLFFFAPLGLLMALVPMELHGAMIAVGWATMGVATFLYALAVQQRAVRLTGLGLLLLAVAKLLAIDVWLAPPVERYIALIVTGAALLLVSFLYSRYREAILRYL